MTRGDLMHVGRMPTGPSACGTSHGGVPSCELRVLIVDDQAIFRAAARDVVAATPGFLLVGEAASGPEALRAIDRLAPDLVLLDVRLPGMSGVEVARRTAASHPATKVVLISADDPRTLPAIGALRGAVALVRKQELSPGRLRHVAANEPSEDTTEAGDAGLPSASP